MAYYNSCPAPNANIPGHKEEAKESTGNEMHLVDTKLAKELKELAINEQQNTGTYIIGKTIQIAMEKLGLWDE